MNKAYGIVAVVLMSGVAFEALAGITDDGVEQIVSRHSPVLTNVYSQIATPYSAKGRTPIGYHIGNGDAAVTARDEKGKWTFIVSPRAYWHGDTVNERSTYAGWSGRVHIRIPELETCPDYLTTLDIYRGELRGQFKTDTASVSMKTHVVRDSNFFVTAIENTGPSPVTVSVELSTGKPYNEHSASAGGAQGDIAYVTRNGKSTTNAASVVCYTSLGSRILGVESKAKSDKPYTAGIEPVKLAAGKVLHVVSSYEVGVVFPKDFIMPDIQAMIVNQTDDAVTPMVKRLKAQTPAAALAMHEHDTKWWKDFWSRSWISIPAEPAVEKQWYGRLFLAACMCREGSFPPGLFTWIDGEKPGWGSDYHWNFNTAFAFNGLSHANHPELVKPYCDLVLAQLPLARQYAAGQGERGVHFGTGTTPYGWMFKGDYQIRYNAADASMHMITWYQLTRDEVWMREKLYPFLKEIAENSASFIVKDGERRVVASMPFEMGCTHMINPTSGIGFMSRVYRTLIELSKQLNVDAGLCSEWEDTLRRMGPVALVEANGALCLSYSEGERASCGGGAPLPLLTFYPQLWFNSDSPEALNAWNTVDQILRCNEIGKAEVLSTHFFAWLVPPAIRCGYPAGKILPVIRNVVTNTMLPNFTYWDQRLSTEHQVIDGIASMFLQSVNGRLIVFPNWEMGTDAEFFQLREDGAFLVSASVKDGVIGDVTVTSEKGAPCRVQNPWPGKGVKVESYGIEVAATRNGDDTYSFVTKPGGVYRLYAAGTAPVYTRPAVKPRAAPTPVPIVQNRDFSDDFSAGMDNWLANYNCWFVRDGSLSVTNWPIDSVAVLKNRIWEDADYEFDVAVTGGGFAEVQFRKEQPFNVWYNQPSAGMVLMLNRSGAVTLQINGGKEGGRASKPGKSFMEPRHVKITTRGPVIRVYLDRDPNPIIDVTSTFCTRGYFVLRSRNTNCRFDNIRITAVK